MGNIGVATSLNYIPIDYDFFCQWREQSWRRRGGDHLELTTQITQFLLQLVESYYPGSQELIEH